jgi:hypothetical protein
MDMLNNTTFPSGPKLFTSTDFLLLNKVGPWAESFSYLLPLSGLSVVGCFSDDGDACGVKYFPQLLHS